MRAVKQLHTMSPLDINQEAVRLLNKLLERATYNLISKLTGITRPTLYRWMSEDVEFEQMNFMAAAWFIVQCETNPKLVQLMSRAPLTYRRLAGRLTGG